MTKPVACAVVFHSVSNARVAVDLNGDYAARDTLQGLRPIGG